MTRDEFRPGSVDVRDDALPVLRGHTERLGTSQGLLYGLALEYAAENEEGFVAYARAERTVGNGSGDSGSI